MIPYFRPPALELGPIDLQPWGALVATGFWVGTWYAQRDAQRRGIDPRPYGEIVTWLAVGALVFGHLGHALFYDPEYYFANPIEFLKVWSGLSSFGGFFGCTVLALYFFKTRKLDLLKFGDVLMVGLTLGWAIGRIGCFVVHDHIGRPVDTAAPWVQQAIGWLAVEFPAGKPGGGQGGAVRFDLGLMDSLVTWIIFFTLATIARSPRRPGLLMGLGPILYGSVRFFLDFLRNEDLSNADVRYAGLTPAQYGCLVIIGLGVFTISRGRHRPPWPEADATRAA